MPDRSRARQLAAEYLSKGDPTGWFEQLYCEAASGKTTVSWADLRPNPNLVKWWEEHAFDNHGKRALTVGCGLGDDAEQLSAWGFETTAFDVAESAIAGCRERFPESRVAYAVADLLRPPREWIGQFDFVLESYTLQVLPPELRFTALKSAASFVKPGGALLLMARGRDTDDPPGEMPWPLTREEVQRLDSTGLSIVSFEDFSDGEDPPVRRFRVFCRTKLNGTARLSVRGSV